MSTPLLLYTGPEDVVDAIHDVVGEHLAVLPVAPTREALAAGLAEATALLDASMKVRIDAAMIDAAPRLRIVVTATTGADHIDGLALQRRGIPLLTLKGQTAILHNLTPAAEHSWLL